MHPPVLVVPRSFPWLSVAAVWLSLYGAGCSTSPLPACPAGERPLVSEALHFGTATPEGVVSPEQWRDFLESRVAPRLRTGFTTWNAEGGWRGPDGRMVREGSHVLSVVHEGEADGALRAIAEDYKTRFRQRAVLRVRAPACGIF